MTLRKRGVLATLAGAGCAVLSGGRAARAQTVATSPAAPAVPAEFQSLATFLSSKLDAFVPGPSTGGSTVFGGELFLGSSNRGEALLNRYAYVSIETALNRMQELGVGGLTLSVHEDVLTRSPRSAEFVAFYRRLCDDIRGRGLTLLIETQASFVGAYEQLTFEAYRQARRAAAQTILTELRPHYLAVCSEPGTEAALTRFAELRTPAAYREFLSYVLTGLQRGQTLVGGGTGTWEDMAYIRDHFVHMDLDFIDLHVYPVNRDYLQRIVDLAGMAQQRGKRVVIGEAWLYKTGDAELLRPATAVYARDVFSFWQPLDQRFLADIVGAARALGVDYASPFWTQYFFASLEHTNVTKVYSPLQASTLISTQAVAAMSAGTLTPTGEYYRSLIRSGMSAPLGG